MESRSSPASALHGRATKDGAKVLTLEGGGLKCDAAGCGWADMTISRAEYPSYRNAACPACGSNILNDADWRALRRLERVVGFLNLLFFWVKPKQDAPENVTEVVFDGTGRPKTKTSRPA